MTINDNELLSALVDGELEGAELKQAIEFLSQNDSAREQLQRYQRSSDLLRGYAVPKQRVDLTSGISAALANEPAYTQTATFDKTKTKKAGFGFLPDWFWQQALGMTIAASIGALAVVSVMNQPQQMVSPIPMASSSTPTAPPVLAVAAAQAPEVSLVQTANRWTVGEPDVAERLNTYLLDHNEYGGGSNIFSNARVIAYEAE